MEREPTVGTAAAQGAIWGQRARFSSELAVNFRSSASLSSLASLRIEAAPSELLARDRTDCFRRAEEYFESDRVLARLLDAVNELPGTDKA